MAMQDGNDPNAGGGDWWTQNAPDPNAYPAQGGTTSLYGAVAQLYRTALGREGTDAEIHQWADGRRPDELAGIQQAIYASDEAKAYSARATAGAVTPPTPNDPVIPPPPTGGGGAPAPITTQPIGVPTSGFGAAPPTYVSNPNAPVYTPLPTYVAPTWQGGDFANPTIEDLYNSPGYGARLDQRMKAAGRQFASQGTVLNGGTLKALDRSAQDYATGEYQTLRNNSFDAYKQRYSQFTDAAGMDLNARTINANQNQNTFTNNMSTYNAGNARTLSDFLTNTTATRNSELDYWNRLNDVNNTGANLAGGSR